MPFNSLDSLNSFFLRFKVQSSLAAACLTSVYDWISTYTCPLDQHIYDVQNDYDELFTLLNWAVPGGLGDWKQFQAFYEEPIKMAQKKDANETALGRVSYTNQVHVK